MDSNALVNGVWLWRWLNFFFMFDFIHIPRAFLIWEFFFKYFLFQIYVHQNEKSIMTSYDVWCKTICSISCSFLRKQIGEPCKLYYICKTKYKVQLQNNKYCWLQCTVSKSVFSLNDCEIELVVLNTNNPMKTEKCHIAE